MKNLIRLLLVIFLASHGSYAQEYQNYQWSSAPEISEISDEDIMYPAVVALDFKLIEHLLEGTKSSTLTTIHKKIHLNNDAGIEKHNKIYVPVQSGSSIIDLKVRAISPEGKITEIQKGNIKELQNVKGFRNVKIFAIEGIEVGGDAEYLYTVKSNFEPFGKEILQSDIPVKKAEIKIYYPSRWSFKYKSYNGLNEATQTLKNGSKMLHLIASDIPAFLEEEYAVFEPKLKRFEYKLVSNGYQSGLFSWDFLSDKLVSNLSTPKGNKAGYKYTKDIANSNASEETKIRNLENKIKSTIRLERGTSAALSDPIMIIKNGVGNSRGISKLFIYCLEAMNIQNQLVFASNRFDGELDPEFANPSTITSMFIYFPKYDKYLMPDAYHMRYGVTHTGLLGARALFVPYTVNINNLISNKKKHYFKTIEGLDEKLNQIGVIATLDFAESLTLPLVTIENYSQGYRSFAFRSGYHYADESQRKEFIKDWTMSSFENFDIKSSSVEGSDITLSSFPEKYFRIKLRYTTPELVQRAGNEYLISVGKVIGKQSELYQEREREHDIAFSSISNYHHEITLEIPEGYVLEGLESIRINNTVELEGKKVMYFVSDYTQKGNSLTITVDEVYSVLNLKKNKYDEFREVINSAANFNKLTLALRKE